MNKKILNERVFSAVLSTALEDFLDKDIAAVKEIISDSEASSCSGNHIRRMVKLVHRSKRKPGRTVYWLKWTAVVFLAVSTVIFASVLSIDAVREVIWATLATKEDGKHLGRDRFIQSPVKPSFVLGYLPSGFAEKTREDIMGGCSIVYENEMDTTLVFHQYPKDADIRHDVGNTKREYSQYNLNGLTVHVYKAMSPEEKSFLIWYDGDYRFGLDSTLDVDELVKIAESIQ